MNRAQLYTCSVLPASARVAKSIVKYLRHGSLARLLVSKASQSCTRAPCYQLSFGSHNLSSPLSAAVHSRGCFPAELRCETSTAVHVLRVASCRSDRNLSQCDALFAPTSSRDLLFRKPPMSTARSCTRVRVASWRSDRKIRGHVTCLRRCSLARLPSSRAPM